MANRDEPVNGKHSELSLHKDGNLVLTDAGRYIIWSTQTKSNSSSIKLQLYNSGNLILHEQGNPVWQSFDHPTDTLLPNQLFTENTKLVSSRSSTNYSSGFYKLYFDTDGILRLQYNNHEMTSIYWPHPSLLPWQVGRYQYLYSQRASLDPEGRFNSTDGLEFLSADFGYGPQRMMKIDMDGNLRVYSLVKHGATWEWMVKWQAVSLSCRIHGIICILLFWINTCKSLVTTEQSYSLAVTPFRKFTYRELKKASRNFRDEIGQGGARVVYKGRLTDKRIAAIKKLKGMTSHQNDNEFQAEISTIGRLNHMNLIETWGYCAEGPHRLIVYEYMENGSLAEKLREGNLDWDTVFNIAKGTAKGLAYLHEECLEWVLHCDVKPQNILLDGNYNPKVADFGFSKLLDRDGIKKSGFSTIRGARGYMAPEWVFKLPITSKVDVFSYGVVVLEMITGRGPGGKKQGTSEDVETGPGLVEWVRDGDGSGSESWIEDVVNGSICGKFDRKMMENLVRIALKCAEDDMQVRPTMNQVVNMLLHPENGWYM
ncbi:putative protein kinase RLK-Pelle-SD-2b family [Helianthus annuus]|nr:putative protein kinase RLK-Pelle-SD-2b family [Helianthus annuus]